MATWLGVGCGLVRGRLWARTRVSGLAVWVRDRDRGRVWLIELGLGLGLWCWLGPLPKPNPNPDPDPNPGPHGRSVRGVGSRPEPQM